MNVAITAIGSVRPVITVLRQLPRKRNTISTVSSAPSMIVHLDVIDRRLDEVRGRSEQLQLSTCGRQFSNVAGGDLQAVANLDDIGVLRLEDIEADRRGAVDARDRTAFTLGVEHFGHLREHDRCPVFSRHDDLAEVGRVLDAAVDPNDRFHRVVADRADRNTDVRVAQRCNDLVDSQAERGQAAGSTRI